MDILRHDGDSLGVDRAQVGVFEQANQVRFGRFLQGQDRGGLESQVSLEILGDFSDQSLERQLSDEQFRGLLVLADFSQRDGTRAVSVRLLDATSRRRGFARGLGRELLSRGFATCFVCLLFRPQSEQSEMVFICEHVFRPLEALLFVCVFYRI